MIGHPNAHTFAFVLFLRSELKAFSPFGKGGIRGIFSDHLCLTHSVYPTYFTGYMYGKVGGWRKVYCCHCEQNATMPLFHGNSLKKPKYSGSRHLVLSINDDKTKDIERQTLSETPYRYPFSVSPMPDFDIFSRAAFSICLILSRVTPNLFPISSSVYILSSPSPNLILTISSSFGVRDERDSSISVLTLMSDTAAS